MFNLMGSASALYDALEDFRSSDVREHIDIIAQLLRHKSVLVRYAAASALGRASLGSEELRAALLHEKNDTVIAEICEALASCQDHNSIEVLKELASSHKSSLVRCAAVEALFEIVGTEISHFLAERYSSEGSRRTLASLSVLLFLAGRCNNLADVGKFLKSRDYLVRCRMANLIAYHRERLTDGKLLRVLEEALSREETRAARSSLEKAIRALSSTNET